ncbi:HET domain containing protein [Hyaloscypha variabilis]
MAGILEKVGEIVDNAPPEISDDKGSENLCSWCKDFDLNEQKFFINPSKALGTNIDDHQRSCTFCDLLWRTIQRYSPGKTTPETALCLTWEVDGRRLTNQNLVVRCTRRIRMSWIDVEDKKHDTYMVLAAPPSHYELNSGSDSRARLDTDVSFLGRVLANPSDIIDLMKKWLRQCCDTHFDGCRSKYGSIPDFRRLVKETYFGVVDVIDMRLTELPFRDDIPIIPEAFVALSYVWGKDKIRELSYMTTRSNVMLRIQPGGLKESWNSLPATIRDAMLLVKRLGFRYVWVDSLCIVQDSVQNWQSNAKAMHLVYLHACFTICAADGDVTSGLHAFLQVPSQPPADPKTTLEHITSTDSGAETSVISAETLPNVQLLVSKLPETVIQDSDWNGRGWTFQERMLSRRCMIFAGDRVYFQCRQMVMSQEIFPDRGGKGWSLDWINSPLRTLAEVAHKAFWFYMKSIPLYTGRKLSKSGDILAAFEGVSWLLEQHLNAPLLYGLPTSHFDLALLWMPLGVLDRRRARKLEQSQSAEDSRSNLETSNNVDEDDFGAKEFPSWSWCGWVNGKMDYTADMIDGCSQNAHEWLEHHTWIQWHIRDYKGYLRPLWNRKKRYEDLSSDVRWKGYAGLPKSPSPGGELAVNDASKSRNGGSEDNKRKRKWQDQADIEQASSLYAHDEINTQDSHYGGQTDNEESSRFHRESNTAYINALPENYYAVGFNPVNEKSSNGPTKSSSLSRRADTKHAEARIGFSGSRPEATKVNGKLDDYGRSIRYDLEICCNFTSILPDNPFGVIRDISPSDIETYTRSMPVLQFFTLSSQFYVKPRSRTGITDQTRQILYCEIFDMAGDCCGCIKLDGSWIANRQETLLHFIAISDAKSFTRNECPEWNYYIHTEREESEWDLYYVLLLERNVERALWERIGLGKIFKAAFADADWTEIKLG